VKKKKNMRVYSLLKYLKLLASIVDRLVSKNSQDQKLNAISILNDLDSLESIPLFIKSQPSEI